MRTGSKIIVGVALAGLAAAGGAAFTGGGVTDGSGATSGFIGGTVSQNAIGAQLTNVAYTYGTQAGTGTVSAIDLTFAAGSNTKAVDVVFTGGSTDVDFTCSAVSSNASHCTGTHTGDVDSLAVTVKQPS